MDKYQVDYSDTAHFKGIRILFEHLEEGLDHAQEHGIKEVCIWTDGDWSKQTIDFGFLKDRPFIETFHWLIPISKKSDIDGLKYLSNIKNIRWSGAGDFKLDLSIFPLLEALNIGYGSKITGWESLKTLKRLQLGGLKCSDLAFLKHCVHLEYLRIIGGSLTSIAGIENCKELKTLFLQKCPALTALQPTLHRLTQLEQLNLEGCKKVDPVQQLAGLAIPHVSMI